MSTITILALVATLACLSTAVPVEQTAPVAVDSNPTIDVSSVDSLNKAGVIIQSGPIEDDIDPSSVDPAAAPASIDRSDLETANHYWSGYGGYGGYGGWGWRRPYYGGWGGGWGGRGFGGGWGGGWRRGWGGGWGGGWRGYWG